MDSEADCSMSLPESFARWDQDTLSWRTSQRSFLEGWEMFLGPWPRSGMTASGIAYRLLPQLMPLIDATESSFWPTPTTQEIEHPNAVINNKGRRVSKNGKSSHSIGLADAVKMIPTPTTSNAKGASKNRYRTSETYRGNLDEWVRDSEDSGQLNPTWVEWLMGFPDGWTDLDA